MLGDQWHSIRRGLAQGCPLSPVLAAAVMAMWSSMVESGPSLALSSMSFVDDRLLWSNTVEELRRAKALSDQFDQAFDLSCDRKKSRFAHREPSVEASTFASELTYEESDALSLLGLSVPLDGSSGPSLKDFCLKTVKVRTRLIGIAARGLVKQARLLRTMVLPMLTWAGGFATIQHEEMEEIVGAFRDLLYSTLAHDTPLVLLYELAGWEIQPQFACELAELREAVRLHCREPSWMEEASVRFAARRWPDLLPTTVKVLTSLGWTWDPRGSYILRLDSYGQERRFVLGVDSFEVLAEWLRDVFRRRFLAKCGRVVQQLHRDAGDDVAQGFLLAQVQEASPGGSPGAEMSVWQERPFAASPVVVLPRACGASLRPGAARQQAGGETARQGGAGDSGGARRDLPRRVPRGDGCDAGGQTGHRRPARGCDGWQRCGFGGSLVGGAGWNW